MKFHSISCAHISPVRKIGHAFPLTGLEGNEVAGKRGGSIAKQARKELEEEIGRRVISGEGGAPPSGTR